MSTTPNSNANANARAKRKMFDAQSQSRIELAAQLSGLGTAFEQAAQLGPQLADLQTALLGGLLRSQQKEAERLAELHGKEDERVSDAIARSERLGALQAELDAQSGVAARVVETFQTDGLFHGYVVLADASDAVGYGVRLTLLDAASGKTTLRKTAKTDAQGYFRIALQTDTGANLDNPTHDVQQLVERVARAIAQDDVGNGTAAAARAAAAEAAEASQVEVFDPAGKLVHEDPMPPRFDGVPSEFRFYVLGDVKTTSGLKMTSGQRRKR